MTNQTRMTRQIPNSKSQTPNNESNPSCKLQSNPPRCFSDVGVGRRLSAVSTHESAESASSAVKERRNPNDEPNPNDEATPKLQIPNSKQRIEPQAASSDHTLRDVFSNVGVCRRLSAISTHESAESASSAVREQINPNDERSDYRLPALPLPSLAPRRSCNLTREAQNPREGWRNCHSPLASSFSLG